MPFPQNLDDRYHSDEGFAVLVDHLLGLMQRDGYPPEEVRDGFLLAAIRRDRITVRPYLVYVNALGVASFSL